MLIKSAPLFSDKTIRRVLNFQSGFPIVKYCLFTREKTPKITGNSKIFAPFPIFRGQNFLNIHNRKTGLNLYN